MLDEPPDAIGVVRAVADLPRPPLEPAGQRDPDRGRRVDRPAEERARRRNGERRRAARLDDDLACARCPGERLPLGLAEHDRAAGVDHRELLGRDRLARRPEHVRVLERRRS